MFKCSYCRDKGFVILNANIITKCDTCPKENTTTIYNSFNGYEDTEKNNSLIAKRGRGRPRKVV